MVQELSQEQIEAIKQIKSETLDKIGYEFDKLDLNGDGSIEKDELLLVASRYGSSGDQMTREKLGEFFQTFDKDSDGVVTRKEWMDWFEQMFDQSLGPLMPKIKQYEAEQEMGEKYDQDEKTGTPPVQENKNVRFKDEAQQDDKDNVF